MLDDMKIIRPHYVPMVPRIMNKIYDGVCEKLAESKIKRALFTYCYNRKKKLLQRFVNLKDEGVMECCYSSSNIFFRSDWELHDVHRSSPF